jgi:hypothetical protein
MKIRQTVTILAVLVVLLAGVASSGFAQTSTPPPRPHHMGHMGPPPPASICTDNKYLYVVIGPKIMQYAIPDLTLKKTVDLPRPTPPEKK